MSKQNKVGFINLVCLGKCHDDNKDCKHNGIHNCIYTPIGDIFYWKKSQSGLKVSECFYPCQPVSWHIFRKAFISRDINVTEYGIMD